MGDEHTCIAVANIYNCVVMCTGVESRAAEYSAFRILILLHNKF
jgi:hypothetical protein